MNINIGENIKNFRKKREITQEELAEHLGISFQSISKWERGEGFPDITMLPDLANFFDVSIDELIGADSNPGGGYFYDTYEQAHEYQLNGDYDKAAELLKDILKKYPDHYDMTAKLASVLLLINPDSEEAKTYMQKAIMLCERRLNGGNMSEKARATARATLCFLYDDVSERQKAKDLAGKLPHIWESREILYAELLDGQEYIDYLKLSMRRILPIISEKIDSIDGKRINVKDMLFLGGADEAKKHQNKHEIMNKIIDFLD
jgi:Predicted transcriptional regulators